MTYHEFWEAICPILIFLAFTVPAEIAIMAIIEHYKTHRGQKWGDRQKKNKEES